MLNVWMVPPLPLAGEGGGEGKVPKSLKISSKTLSLSYNQSLRNTTKINDIRTHDGHLTTKFEPR